MKKCKAIFIIVIYLLIFFNFSSCTIKKRLYMDGYYINRVGRIYKSSNSGNNNVKQNSHAIKVVDTINYYSISSEPIIKIEDETVNLAEYHVDEANSLIQDVVKPKTNKFEFDSDYRNTHYNFSHPQASLINRDKKQVPKSKVVIAEPGNPIFTIIILALTLLGVVKMLFTIGKKPYKELTIDEINSQRKLKGLPEESTEEESELAWNTLLSSTGNWYKYSDENGDTVMKPRKRKQIKETSAILKSVQDMLPTNPKVLEYMNEIGYFTNSMAHRSFAGSIPLVIVSVLSLIVLALFTGGPFFTALLSLWWLFASIIFYIFASRAPRYLIDKRLEIFNGTNLTSSFIAGFFSMFLSTPSTETYKYTYSDGSTEISEELNFGKIFLFFLMAIAYLFLGICIHLFGLLNFIRNYLLYF